MEKNDTVKKRPARRSRRFLDFYDAWQFLEHHPMFNYHRRTGNSCFWRCLSLDVVKVNPGTGRIEYAKDGKEDARRNTSTQVWLECGPWLRSEEYTTEERKSYPEGGPSYDPGLDCGAETFEEAVRFLAEFVYEQYGMRRKSRRRWKTREEKEVAKAFREARREMEELRRTGNPARRPAEEFLAELRKRRRKGGKKHHGRPERK